MNLDNLHVTTDSRAKKTCDRARFDQQIDL